MEKFFPAGKILVTGNPIRPSIANVDAASQEAALKFFGLQPGKNTVLIVGGSLGARSINEAISKGLDQLLQNDLQLIWQTGKTALEKWKTAAKGRSGVWVNDFITEMEKGYAAADIVVSRAGAMAKAELCVVKKPVLFVPYPYAAEDHQTVNAINLVEKNAALIVKDDEAVDQLVPKVVALAQTNRYKMN
jgi:UDP-N-acetylglucosamine--N-acetylmuramyl-(pentapeptide) pyrophosphoryl-undecaprenol N-acetylglucosamine transferase